MKTVHCRLVHWRMQTGAGHKVVAGGGGVITTSIARLLSLSQSFRYDRYRFFKIGRVAAG